jgi:hypothetical protein
MGKKLDILDVPLIAAAVLQITAVQVLARGSNYTQLLQGVDLTALQAGFSLTACLF